MNFDIRQHAHYLVVSGSHSYGLNTPESDVDISGWCVPPRAFLYTFTLEFDQYNDKVLPEKSPFIDLITGYAKDNAANIPNEPLDATVYNLKKFMKLACDCNPNIIDLLYVDDAEILFMDAVGKTLRENANLFLSRRAKYSFTGYAVSQLKRIDTHRRWLLNPPKVKPERADFGLPETSLIPADHRQAALALIEKQVRLWMLEEAEVDKGLVALIQEDLVSLVAHIMKLKERQDVKDKIEAAASQLYGMTTQYITVLQQEKRYKAALDNYHSYLSWVANRNPKRAEIEKEYGFDLKHAGHLARLLLEAEEILNTGTLHLKDTERIKFLREVRQGGWNYNKLMEWVKPKLTVLEDRTAPCVLPEKPDRNKLNVVYGNILSSAFATEEIPVEQRNIGPIAQRIGPSAHNRSVPGSNPGGSFAKIPGLVVHDTASWCHICNPGLEKK